MWELVGIFKVTAVRTVYIFGSNEGQITGSFGEKKGNYTGG